MGQIKNMSSDKNVTEPPCESCLAHDGLENKMNSMQKQNNTEHVEILQKLDRAVGNIRWMNIIGKWLLATMLSYFIAVGYYIATGATKKDIVDLQVHVENGEKLHYKNENHITKIDTKLDMIVNYIKENKK